MEPVKIYKHKDVEAIIELYGELLFDRDCFATIKEHLEEIKNFLWNSLKNKSEAALKEVSNYHPYYMGKTIDELVHLPLNQQDAELTISNEYGFKNWDNLIEKSKVAYNYDFEDAVDFAISGQANELNMILQRSPIIIDQCSQFGHKATILHYLIANGTEMWRQIVPDNLIDIVKLLLDYGCTSNKAMIVYGGEYYPYELIDSSAHLHSCNLDDQLKMLLK
ncbi:hypothetical protein [Marinigracilibium pacificum]|uniref:Uncharacterized protein n=1 Tax=Marinigracilibium pacificum TaxID=2729599 RepID=A0A848IS66_9BACT|nr:hypothetical protein [Marinigracilibium pacificum]NMM47293.1 hypothetical protein [Marinigracilibium pacificum]